MSNLTRLSFCLAALLYLSSVQVLAAEFVLMQTFTGLYSTAGIALADFDGDDNTDFVVGGGGNSRPEMITWTRQGNSFRVSAEINSDMLDDLGRPRTADFNGDGLDDILVQRRDSYKTSNSFYTLVNLGDGSFRRGDKLIYRQFSSSDFVDLNSDGSIDLIQYDSQSRSMNYYLNDGTGNFGWVQNVYLSGIPSVGSCSLHCADFDDDGNMDFSLSLVGEPYFAIRYGDADLSFEREQKVSLTGSGFHAVADFNNDGLPDIVQLNSESYLSVLINQGDGNFTTVVPLSIPAPTYAATSELYTADVNGDGLLDLLSRIHGLQGIQYFENLGDGNFDSPEMIAEELTEWGRYYVTVAEDGETIMVSEPSVRNEVYYFRNARTLGQVSGTVFANIDGSCEIHNESVFFDNQIVEASPGGWRALVDEEGRYTLALPTGEYTFALKPNSNWIVNCGPEAQFLQVVDNDDPTEGLDFALKPRGALRDLHVSLVASRIRPGIPAEYIIQYKNIGTVPYSGALDLHFEDFLEITGYSRQPDMLNSGFARWNLQNLAVGDGGSIVVNFLTPEDMRVGTEICARIEAELKRTDLLLDDYRDELCVEVTGGFDPNDIQVWPGGDGEDGLISADTRTLSYMIRFQNTGNDTTFKVVVLDTLPQGLKVQNLRFGASSHKYSVDVIDNDILSFTFDDIMLPDSTSNPLASQGFVRFRIDLVEDWPLGKTIVNRAGIYFDFNEVIMTNAVNTTLRSVSTTVGDEVHYVGNLNVYPNPASELVSIDGLDPAAEVLEIVDLLGRRVLRFDLTDQTQIELRLGDLEPGAYFLRAQGNSTVQVARIELVN